MNKNSVNKSNFSNNNVPQSKISKKNKHLEEMKIFL